MSTFSLPAHAARLGLLFALALGAGLAAGVSTELDAQAAPAAQAGGVSFTALDEARYLQAAAMSTKSVAVDVGDVDGDGDLDAFVGNIKDCQDCLAANRVWLNDGAGDFTDSGQLLGDRNSWGVALGDVDGDGDLDAFAANGYGAADGNRNTVWLNDGAGVFSDSGQQLGDLPSWHVALGDVDGDGDLDAVVANYGANTVWTNDGAGRFSDTGLRIGDERSNVVALADMDGDGDLDLMIGNTGRNQVWWNDSAGGGAAIAFTDSGMRLGEEHSIGDGPATRDLALGDLDGDGDLDVYMANGGVGLRDGKAAEVLNTVYLAEPDLDAPGRVRYVDTGQRLGVDFSFGVDLADVDDDGDLDAFVADSYLCGTVNHLWLNDGQGTFSDSGQPLGIGNGWDVRFGDLDGDGDPDAFLVNYGPAPDSLCRFEEGAPNEVWINDGDHRGIFAERFDQRFPGIHAIGFRSTGVALADLNGDGALDAFVTNRGNEDPRPGETDQRTTAPDTVWLNLNDGTGALEDTGQRLGGLDSRGVALGDIDGDGDVDAFVTQWADNASPDAPDTVWTNDGTGRFTDTGQRLGAWRSNVAALGDLDGDGDLDAFVASTAEDWVWLNDGAGTFTDSGQRLGDPHPGGLGPNTEDIALGDLDGDGDLDAFAANGGIHPGENPNTIWINQGDGTFLDPGLRMGDEFSFDVALADFDGDGDLDAYVGNSSVCGQPNELWLNDGSGRLTDSGQRLGDGNTMSVATGDFDCDGDIDVFAGNVSVAKVDGFVCPAECPIQRTNRVWLNDGNGVFTDSGVAIGNSSTMHVAAGDLDDDGAADIYAANAGRCGLLNRVWISNCLGQQATATPIASDTPQPSATLPASVTPIATPSSLPPPPDTPGPGTGTPVPTETPGPGTGTPEATNTPGPGTPSVTPAAPTSETPSPDPPTATPGPTDTPGGPATATLPPSPTPEATSTPGGPATETPLPSPTPDGPPTATATPGGPATPTPLTSPTPGGPPTSTPEPSSTPVSTNTPGGPATATPTPAPTNTPGGPPSTATPLPTDTPLPTPTAPGPPSATPTPGGPPTATPPSGPTATPMPTDTPSGPATATPAPTDTPSGSPTATAIPSSLPPTVTPVATDTPGGPATATPVASDTPAPTDTPGPGTPSVTPAPSDTPAPTETPQPPGPTNTPAPTDTPAPTSTPLPSATPQPTATPVAPPPDICICPIILRLVPASVIDAVRANPDSIAGRNDLHDPGKPESIWNPRRKCLGLVNRNRPYHPTFNPLTWRAWCYGEGCVLP